QTSRSFVTSRACWACLSLARRSREKHARPRSVFLRPAPSGRFPLLRTICGSGLAGVVCEQGDLDAVVELELLEHTRDMCLHGRDAHVALAAGLRVRLAQLDGDRSLALALWQSVEPLAGSSLPLVGLALGYVADQSASDRR